MAKIDASKQLPLERKYQVFVNGYEIDVATALTPAVDTTTFNEPVYGSDDPLTDTIVNNGTITVEVKEKKKNNVLLDNLCNVSPDLTEKAYNFNNFVKVAIWANRKDIDNSKYIGAEFYGRVSMTPSGKTGAPNEWSGRTFEGICDAPRKFEIDGVGIASEKIAITAGSGTLSGTPYQNPDDDLYALYVVALVWDEANKEITNSEILTVTSNMVQSDKSVTITASDLSELTLSDVNAAFVVYLSSGGGVYPTGTIKMEGIYKSLS